MDINSILNGVKCQCGKTHNCDIEYVYIEKNAALRLKEICKDNKNILIVADENTYAAAGEKTKSALEGKNIKEVIFSGKTVLIPNEDAIAEVEKKLDGIDLIVGVGSGVIQDLCKYMSFFNKIPYIIVATAPSMDGYASSGAAMILKGMKDTVSVGMPKAIIADIDVLKNAPMDMIKAGYGDIIGKYSSLCDWRLSQIVNDEYFCQYIYDVVMETTDKTLKTAEGLLKRDEESIKALTEALMIVGIMISFAGSSRPASGSEHHLSHFFEITGIVHGEDYFPHGLDVAYSAVVTTELRERILKREFSDKQFCLPRSEYEEVIKKLYGVVGDGCIALQDKLGTYEKDRVSIYKEREKEIREVLSDMPTSERMIEMLSLAEINMDDFYKFYGEEKINNAIYYAKDLKDRYTVLWLYYDMFGMEA